jgi:hypothetical protein
MLSEANPPLGYAGFHPTRASLVNRSGKVTDLFTGMGRCLQQAVCSKLFAASCLQQAVHGQERSFTGLRFVQDDK